MHRPIIVVALGGNAILRKGEKGSPEESWRNARKAARALLEAYTRGYNLVVTHGNGPQAGYLLEAIESLPSERPRQTLDIIDAMTQGWLGYIIQHAITLEARRLHLNVRAVSLVTRVVVSKNDPAFRNPSKPVGFYYSEAEAEKLARERGWILKPDPRGGYRRVVPSPRPIDVIEHDIVKRLALEGTIVIAVGGGGIPVTEDLEPVEAVVDKDLASSVLATRISAERLVILTDVPAIAVNFGKPNQKWLRRITTREARELLEKGEFPPGSMGPKVEAAIYFAERTCRRAVVGHLDEAVKVIDMKSGTIIEPANCDRIK
ncbi:MAG: carbamate kinase [Desulfurococcales archaeon]|nr:carbamate kinase [Desulfurococcales archaeon]